ncbi:MAG TPA: hypothetical protein VM077_05280 [Candidatus Limnocylindrales bacterium]|nr:hypothetical protein [Candidatus Limnocylindrales bacterium]
MDKERLEIIEELTGYSEEKNDKKVDKPVDLTAGQWSSVSNSILFTKKKKKNQRG